MSDDGEEYEQITDEEKLQIAQHYLLSSPPGQFNEVLSDVRKIVSDAVLPDSIATGIARVHNNKSSKVVTAPDGKKTVLSATAEIDATHYFNPRTKTTFSVDHLTLATNEDEVEFPVDSNLDGVRDEIQQRIENYAKIAYNPTEQHAAGAFARNDLVTIVISGEKTNLKNFWSGRWSSHWNLTKGDSSASVVGEIKIHVHYFEDGNLQMQSTKSIASKTINFSSDSDLAAQVISHIQAEENALQAGLEDMYSNMNNETIRSMRRVMPITKTKMDWNVNAVRMVRQVRK